MKRSLSLLLCFTLLSFLSLNLFSQSAQDELDQVKLAQQLLGTWEAKTGVDTIILWTVTPAYGKGLTQKLEWKAGGKVYSEAISVIGFSDDSRTIFMTWVWGGGDMTIDVGRFVSEKKLVMERIRQSSPMHAVALEEMDFSTPNMCMYTHSQRGQNITWEPFFKFSPQFTKID
jgi:hypothetical protein